MITSKRTWILSNISYVQSVYPNVSEIQGISAEDFQLMKLNDWRIGAYDCRKHGVYDL